MSWDGEYFALTFVAAEDLSTNGHVGTAIAIVDNKLANTAKEAAGILLPHSKPKSGEHGSIGYIGCMKFRAGPAVAKDDELTVTTSGYIITAVASGGWRVGRCVEAAASGGIGVGIFNFANVAWDATSS